MRFYFIFICCGHCSYMGLSYVDMKSILAHFSYFNVFNFLSSLWPWRNGLFPKYGRRKRDPLNLQSKQIILSCGHMARHWVCLFCFCNSAADGQKAFLVNAINQSIVQTLVLKRGRMESLTIVTIVSKLYLI